MKNLRIKLLAVVTFIFGVAQAQAQLVNSTAEIKVVSESNTYSTTHVVTGVTEDLHFPYVIFISGPFLAGKQIYFVNQAGQANLEAQKNLMTLISNDSVVAISAHDQENYYPNICIQIQGSTLVRANHRDGVPGATEERLVRRNVLGKSFGFGVPTFSGANECNL